VREDAQLQPIRELPDQLAGPLDTHRTGAQRAVKAPLVAGKIALTYLVPFSVSTYSALQINRLAGAPSAGSSPAEITGSGTLASPSGAEHEQRPEPVSSR
jgi:hypothetical protein